jgi:hypothetical protein
MDKWSLDSMEHFFFEKFENTFEDLKSLGPCLEHRIGKTQGKGK